MWNGFLYINMNMDLQKRKKKKKRRRNTMCGKNKDVEYKNKICSLALDDMLDHNRSACTNAILSQ